MRLIILNAKIFYVRSARLLVHDDRRTH